MLLVGLLMHCLMDNLLWVCYALYYWEDDKLTMTSVCALMHIPKDYIHKPKKQKKKKKKNSYTYNFKLVSI